MVFGFESLTICDEVLGELRESAGTFTGARRRVGLLALRNDAATVKK